MCLLLQYLCDCQVRQSIEAIVAFSDDFVAKLQDNQRFRYNEVMQAFKHVSCTHSQENKGIQIPASRAGIRMNGKVFLPYFGF